MDLRHSPDVAAGGICSFADGAKFFRGLTSNRQPQHDAQRDNERLGCSHDVFPPSCGINSRNSYRSSSPSDIEDVSFE